ncbi:hypothetical protein [Cryobacterium sp. Y50]|uniref:hypothetical protein n=1 Tax=Cryobacterium sp. Y50 TaxID=2048286 RepID=UPI00130496B7|nr:hypothetical protein [Cryobacterium sp. Y50]
MTTISHAGSGWFGMQTREALVSAGQKLSGVESSEHSAQGRKRSVSGVETEP